MPLALQKSLVPSHQRPLVLFLLRWVVPVNEHKTSGWQRLMVGQSSDDISPHCPPFPSLGNRDEEHISKCGYVPLRELRCRFRSISRPHAYPSWCNNRIHSFLLPCKGF